MALAANREKTRRPGPAEGDSQHPAVSSNLVSASSLAKAHRPNETSAMIDEQPHRGTEAVAGVRILRHPASGQQFLRVEEGNAGGNAPSAECSPWAGVVHNHRAADARHVLGNRAVCNRP